MVFRFIIRYLANNEQLVSRLADSYPVRRAAKFTVFIFNHTKRLVESEIASGKYREINLSNMSNLAKKLETTLKQIKDNLEKQTKK